MKKKISLLLCILVMSLSFAGCSDKKNGAATYDKATLEQSAEFIINNFSAMEDEELDSFKDATEFQLESTLYQTGLKISGESFIAMIDSWKAAEQECGAYESHGDYVVEEKSNEIILSTNAQYKDRSATISFTFDQKMSMKSMDVSAKFSTKEILTKAGLNTLLGMGVVFAVLIFLASIIGLFQYVPQILGQTEGKEKKAEVKVSVEPKPVSIEPVPVANASDDLELIAVITAAIAAQEGTSSDGFIVRSIRRRPSNNWN